MHCRCGGVLFVDLRSVVDAAWQHYAGGRVYCLFGCPQPHGGWTTAFIPPEVGAAAHHGKYHRDAREAICKKCHQPFWTKAPNAQRDPRCAKAMRTARARLEWKERQERKRAARLAVAVA